MKRIISVFLAMIMLLSALSVISVSAYTKEQNANNVEIFAKDSYVIAAYASYKLEYNSSTKCIKTHNRLDYVNTDESSINLSGYLRLTVVYSSSEYEDYESECGGLFTQYFHQLSTYMFIPYGRVCTSAISWCQTNTDAVANSQVYLANPAYESESMALVLNNP